MKFQSSLLLLAAAGLALPLASQAQSARVPQQLRDTFRVERYVEPIFPVALRNKSVSEGYAQVQLLVAGDGSVLEIFTSACSRPEFGEAAERALNDWKFGPAADPTSLPQRFNMRIDFRREGMLVVQGDFLETVNAFLGHTDPDTAVTVCKLRELDATPEITNMVVPLYPESLKKQKIEGAAAVSFYIDEEGRVHVPVVAGSTRPEFAIAALDAVKQWTFAPPLRRGVPTRVFAVQEFSFSPEPTAPRAKTGN